MERTWKADYEKFARTARENVAATLDNMDYPALERAAELILAAKAAGKRLHPLHLLRGKISGQRARTASRHRVRAYS